MSGTSNEENQQPSNASPPPPPPGKPPGHMKQVWLGIGLLAVLHLLLFLLPIAFFFIGIAQLVYLLPALAIFSKRSGIVQGLLIGAGVTFLLNAACFGLLVSGTFSL
ncbi:hypothetical protein RB620_29630 [Paenibacillus sp. LHD-117]|uniref:hypothetical protein n=1 Tax=Paenibacillus sp. LHD-117 TaxID=3071412 RepID=UPI0027E0D3E5|nr:hypothetical protein [Paenibacillus sp. LHD-117]MDQ6423578.1 hypothetical protein [Paenibacillus sp. LHD-117]